MPEIKLKQLPLRKVNAFSRELDSLRSFGDDILDQHRAARTPRHGHARDASAQARVLPAGPRVGKVDNFVELRALAPDLRIVPVVQGWAIGSHLRCVEMYAAAGVDLCAEPVVGVGSVCRRPNPVTVALIVDELHAAGLRGLHGFGVLLPSRHLLTCA